MKTAKFGVEKLKYLFQTDSICTEGDRLYFSAKYYDGLVAIDLSGAECRIEKRFCEETETTSCAHSKVIYYKHSIYCIPRYSCYIVKYDLDTGMIDRFLVPDVTDNRSVFTEAVRVGGKIICFPEFYDWVISFDLETTEITKIKKVTGDETPKGYIFTSNAEEKENEILIPFFSEKQMLRIDKVTEEVSVVDLCVDSTSISGMACVGNTMVFMDDEKTCFVFNKDGEQLAEWKGTGDILYRTSHGAWIVDKVRRRICKVDPDKPALEEYRIKNAKLTDEACSWIESAEADGQIYVIVHSDSDGTGILWLDGEKEDYKPVSVQRLIKEFYESKLMFWEHAGTFLSVMDILNNVRRRSGGTDDSCGEVIHQLMKKE